MLRPGHSARPSALGNGATARPALSLSQRSRLMKAFGPRAGWQLIETAGLKLGPGLGLVSYNRHLASGPNGWGHRARVGAGVITGARGAARGGA
jgi:hypothetical protein